MQKTIIAAMIAAIILAGCTGDDTIKDALPGDVGTITVALWNVYPLDKEGIPPAKNLESVADRLRQYDIIVIQGIKDKSGESFKGICDLMPAHQCELSQDRGDMAKRERHGIIYKGVSLEDTKDFSYLLSKDFVRQPLAYTFRAGEWKFRITTLHPDPNNVRNELRAIDQLTVREGMAQTENMVKSELIVGTLYGSCKAFDPGDALTSWYWAITDEADTLKGDGACVEDRILVNHDMKTRFIKAGIAEGIPATDHKIAYAIFSAD